MLRSEIATSDAVRRSGLEHRVHLPGTEENTRTVILVHGRAGTSQLMWSFSAAFSRFDPFAVAPQGFLEDPVGGWSWWLLEQNPDSHKVRQTTYRQLEPALERLENFVLSLSELYGRSLGEIYALGFSQGAAMVGTLSLMHPTLFSGVGMLAGFLPKIVIEEQAFVDPRVISGEVSLPRYFLAHGSEDEVIPLNRAERARDLLRGYGAEAELIVDATGHKVGSSGMRALRAWFETAWLSS